ncbi:unnamed protein product [Gordionus sp. m RMFG-2023]|uniref:RCC1 domain-containing protein 1-like isoform X2 n=1 Tax=Gordionus sp. m RMFG-2023 TaxID=3053472 RepID=UPI0030DE67C7
MIDELKLNKCQFIEIIKVKDISIGKEHILLLTDNLNLYSYGNSRHGELGIGDCQSSDKLYLIDALSGLNIVKISAGGWHNIVLTDTGDIYTWGWNLNGQLGLSDSCEFCQSEFQKFTEIANNKNKRKHASNIQCLPHPIIIGDDDENEVIVKDIACGSQHTIVLTDNDVLYSWGWNKYGQIGEYEIEFPQEIRIPQKMPFYNQNKILKLYAGSCF